MTTRAFIKSLSRATWAETRNGATEIFEDGVSDDTDDDDVTPREPVRGRAARRGTHDVAGVRTRAASTALCAERVNIAIVGRVVDDKAKVEGTLSGRRQES